MSEMIKVLVLEAEGKKYHVPEDIVIESSPYFQTKVKKPYDLVIIDKIPEKEELAFLYEATKEYCLYITADIQLQEEALQFFNRKMGKRIEKQEIPVFLQTEAKNYFPSSYGEKFGFNNFSISQKFKGKIRWTGNYSVHLEGDFGEELKQIGFWRNNIPIDKGQALELWLEYKKDANVELALTVVHFASGTISTVEQQWFFTQEDMKQPVIIDNRKSYGPIFVYLSARGKGTLDIIALHDRYSRRGHGYFIPGGERYVTSEREEVFAYFNPGDLKPPLHIYFSGYKTKQGFEGYHLMKSMKSPFLLIAEARLEGGSFYLGSKEYEELLIGIMKKYRDQLGFTGSDVIMSGLSMGTFGALYYSPDLLPHSVVLGKPLASIGYIAENERIKRPSGFPTSLDVLKYVKNHYKKEDREEVNEIFWEKLEKVHWGDTKFVISYMIEDDYDSNAYQNLITRLDPKGIQIYGKGIHGRHNDNTYEIVRWYRSQLKKILREDYNRRPV
ncbi:MAG: accessory Sec system protein Asp2 [Lachnospiraceae bacterium]|nr:accessory Sec system protein Asp2 [Lachnospiraceae bacterium]